MSVVPGIPDDQVAMLYELREVYDGWSVARLKDGRLINRWPPGTHRHSLAQDWIELTTTRRGATTNS